MESYSEQLEREVKEVQLKYPGIEKMMQEIKIAHSMSNMEIDYSIERDARAYRTVDNFLKTLFDKNLNMVKVFAFARWIDEFGWKVDVDNCWFRECEDELTPDISFEYTDEMIWSMFLNHNSQPIKQNKNNSVVINKDCPNEYWYSFQEGSEFNIKSCNYSDFTDVEGFNNNEPDECWKVTDGEFANSMILKKHCTLTDKFI